MSTPSRTLYRYPLSGHSHRVELMLSLLYLPVERIDVDLRKGAHKQADFLALNAFGQVPVLVDNGLVLADSNAILVYLARTYGDDRWMPSDPVGAAVVQRWLSVAAGQIATGPATARLITVFGAPYNAEDAIGRSHALLRVMETELTQRPFLAGNTVSIADIAAYTYIAHAPEGNVSLAEYPQVRRWLQQIEALPGFIPMQKTLVALQVA